MVMVSERVRQVNRLEVRVRWRHMLLLKFMVLLFVLVFLFLLLVCRWRRGLVFRVVAVCAVINAHTNGFISRVHSRVAGRRALYDTKKKK